MSLYSTSLTHSLTGRGEPQARSTLVEMMNSELMQAKLKDPSLGVRAKSELHRTEHWQVLIFRLSHRHRLQVAQSCIVIRTPERPQHESYRDIWFPDRATVQILRPRILPR